MTVHKMHGKLTFTHLRPVPMTKWCSEAILTCRCKHRWRYAGWRTERERVHCSRALDILPLRSRPRRGSPSRRSYSLSAPHPRSTPTPPQTIRLLLAVLCGRGEEVGEEWRVQTSPVPTAGLLWCVTGSGIFELVKCVTCLFHFTFMITALSRDRINRADAAPNDRALFPKGDGIRSGIFLGGSLWRTVECSISRRLEDRGTRLITWPNLT